MFFYGSEPGAEAPGTFRTLTAPPSPKESWEFVGLLGEDWSDRWNAKIGSLRWSLSVGDILCHTFEN